MAKKVYNSNTLGNWTRACRVESPGRDPIKWSTPPPTLISRYNIHIWLANVLTEMTPFVQVLDWEVSLTTSLPVRLTPFCTGVWTTRFFLVVAITLGRSGTEMNILHGRYGRPRRADLPVSCRVGSIRSPGVALLGPWRGSRPVRASPSPW